MKASGLEGRTDSVCVYTCMYMYICMCTCISICIRICICTCTCTCICICIYIYMYICLRVCIKKLFSQISVCFCIDFSMQHACKNVYGQAYFRNHGPWGAHGPCLLFQLVRL